MITIAHEKDWNGIKLPNGLSREHPFFKHFVQQSREYRLPYCKTPLPHLLSEEKVQFQEKMVSEVAQSGEPFIFLMEMLYSFPVWLKKKDGTESKINPFNFISEDTLSLIRSGQGVLVLTHLKKVERDPFDANMFIHLHEKVASLNIPEENVVFITCTEEAEDYYWKTFLPLHSKWKPFQKVKSISYFEWGWNSYYKSYLQNGQVFTREDYESIKDFKRPYRFLCFNREPRAHRLINTLWMQRQGLLNKALISFPQEDHYFEYDKFDAYEEGVDHIFNDPNILKLKSDLWALKAKLPLTVDKDNLHDIHISWCTREPWKQTYFSLVTERLFHNPNDHILLTSKTFKCMGNMHPFLLIGPKGALKALRDKGYKTFSPFINETYDEESNPNRRIQMIWKEILRLVHLSDSEIHKWSQQLGPILRYNWNHCHERMENSEIQTLFKDVEFNLIKKHLAKNETIDHAGL